MLSSRPFRWIRISVRVRLETGLPFLVARRVATLRIMLVIHGSLFTASDFHWLLVRMIVIRSSYQSHLSLVAILTTRRVARWSSDTLYRALDYLLLFVARRQMIKNSSFRKVL